MDTNNGYIWYNNSTRAKLVGITACRLQEIVKVQSAKARYWRIEAYARNFAYAIERDDRGIWRVVEATTH